MADIQREFERLNAPLFGQLAKLAGMRHADVLMAGADRIVEGSRSRTPVDKGYLAQDQEAVITVDDVGRPEVEVRVGHNLDALTGRAYAGYVEFGTVKMAAQPFLRPAVDEDMPAAYGAMVKKLWENLKEVLGL